MKIGIVAPIEAKSYLDYFQTESDRNILCNYCFDYTVPAVTTLTRSLLKKGHTVLIFTTSIRAFELKTKNLEIYSVKAARTPLKYVIDGFSLYREISRHIANVDILHAHWTYEFAMGASFFSKKKPVLCTVRDWAPYIWTVISIREKIYWASKVLINKYIQSKKRITFIGNSEYTQNLLKDKLKRSVDYVPNPISNAFILETERSNVNKNVVVLCISSSSISDRRKNVPNLLKAFQLFKRHNNGAKLLLVGNFSENDPAVKPYRESGLLEDVEIRGKVAHDRLKDVIDEASFMVAPSLEETFGNTLIESMARKLPVIGGQNSGAVPYVLSKGKAGYLCDVKSPQSICEAMTMLINDKKSTNEKVQYAYKKVLTLYSEESVCNKHLEIYNNLVHLNLDK